MIVQHILQFVFNIQKRKLEHGEAPGPPPLKLRDDPKPEVQIIKPWRIPTTFHPQSNKWIRF